MKLRYFSLKGLMICLISVSFVPGTIASQTDNPYNFFNPSRSDSNVVTYSYPRSCPKSSTFKVRAGGKEVFVYNTSAGAFAAFDCKGPVTIEIETPGMVKNIRVAPAKQGILTKKNGNSFSFEIPTPMNLLIEVEGLEQLYLYANPIEENAPSPTALGVHYFKAGQVYEVGELRLLNNETLYIEGGAVVRGCVRATSAKNVHIAGHGIFDGSYYQKGIDGHRSILLEDCRDSHIDDIIMIEPSSWMIVLGACDNVIVRNVKELGTLSSTDGADIVGSTHIRIENCFFRNGDDCIAIKSLDLREHGKDATLDFNRDVDDIEITGCAFIAYLGGTALEIGHELRTTSIRNIRFRNCDILGVHGFGGVFGIHDADRATVSDVLYENIRVEHHYNKLIDLKVIKSMWGKDLERGQIRNVTFRNINVTLTMFNPGYSFSLIGGYDAKHTVENVIFENFCLDGKPASTADQIDLYCKQAKNIKFK
jgi:hypothetical protein